MQVLSSKNQTEKQQLVLLNLFQKWIDLHSDDYENQNSNTKSANQSFKREWNYFKDLLNISPLNTDKITSYFHLLERNQLQSYADSSPVNSPSMRPSYNTHEIASSKSPNTRIYTINESDVPKNAFQKNCFKKGANSTSNRNYYNQNPQINSQNFDPSSPQVLSSRDSSDKQFSQAVFQLENASSSSRSPNRSIPNQNQFSSTAGASLFSKNLNTITNSSGNSQDTQQAQKQIPSQFSYSSSEYNSQQQNYGIKQDDVSINQFQVQQQISQQVTQVPYNKSIDNQQINSQSDIITTKNNSDKAINIPSLEANQTLTKLEIKSNNLNLPSANTAQANQNISSTSNPTSLQIENLMNQTQQFYKEYKSQQIDSSKPLQQYQNHENSKLPAQTLTPIPADFNRGLYNQYLQFPQQNQNHHQQYSSLDHNKVSSQTKVDTLQHLRALSPSYQGNQYHMSSSENRLNSPAGQLGQPGLNASQQPSNSNKNALNYKNKLLQEANQAITLNQLSIVQTGQAIQPKSESFSGGFSNSSNANSNSGVVGAQNYQIPPTSNFGLQASENSLLVQKHQSSMLTGMSPKTQPAKIVGSTFSEQQQNIIDDMIRYQFKTKNISEKTQLLETYMKNNSAALNKFISD